MGGCGAHSAMCEREETGMFGVPGYSAQRVDRPKIPFACGRRSCAILEGRRASVCI